MKLFKDINFQVIVAIVAGIVFGLLLPELALKQKVIGTIFVKLLKMLVVPLIFASIFTSIAGLGGLDKLK